MKSVISLFMIIVLLAGCSVSAKLNREYARINKEDFRKARADTTFLKLEGNFYDKPWLLYENLDTYLRVLDRLASHVKVKANRLIWDFKSAEEVRVSEDIYRYFVSTWERYNERLAKGKEELYINDSGYFSLRWKEE